MMLPQMKINLREVSKNLKLVKKIINPRKRVLILHSDFIQLSVVYTHSKGPVITMYKEHRSTPWENTKINEVLIKKIL